MGHPGRPGSARNGRRARHARRRASGRPPATLRASRRTSCAVALSSLPIAVWPWLVLLPLVSTSFAASGTPTTAHHVRGAIALARVAPGAVHVSLFQTERSERRRIFPCDRTPHRGVDPAPRHSTI